MYRVSQDVSRALGGELTLLVPTRQSAQTLRLAHAAAQLHAGHTAWRSPEILPWYSWLERLLTAATLADGPLAGFCLLNAAQERSLWRSAAARSAAPPGLAERLQHSAALMSEYRLESALRPDAGSDMTTQLLRAVAAFRTLCGSERCFASGTATEEQLSCAAAQLAAPVVLVGFAQLTPRQSWFLEMLATAGLPSTRLPAEPYAVSASVRVTAAPDFAGEVALVAAWSREQLERNPASRLLVVTTDQKRERATLQRVFAATLAPRRCAISGDVAPYLEGALRFEHGQLLGTRPAIEQALLVLALRTHSIEMAQLTTLLHAPFVGPASGTPEGQRLRLDLWLRELGQAEFSHDDLDRALQCAPPPFAAAGNWLATALRQLRATLSAARLPLRAWAERFGAAVDGFGWPGAMVPGGLAALPQEVGEWRELLGEFAALDAMSRVAAELDCDEAVAALLELLASRELQPPLRDAAITVADRSDLTDRRQAPVVGYDGIWILGMDAGSWPQAARPDPLLPLATQRAAALPQASVAGRMAQARASLAAWTAAGAEVVLSWAQAQGEILQQASPLLLEFATAGDVPKVTLPQRLVERIAAGQTLERRFEDRGVAWGSPGTLPGGVLTPQLQGECAFRAYAQLRLHAQPLAVPAPGIAPRVRGALLHRCLDLVWAQLQGSEGLARRGEPQLRACILAAFDRALAELLGRELLPPEPRLLERERRRTLRVVLELLELERRRAAFTVLSLEQRELLRVDGAALRFRVDRVDRLEDGSTVIIDYKSGSAGSFDPFDARPQPVQLFAYASALLHERVAALAIAQLGRPVRFVAVADRDDRLPRLRASVPDWPAQLQRWHVYVETLVREFLAGIAVVDPQPLACRYCHLPALCRIDALRIQDEPPEAQLQTEAELQDE